MNRSSRAMRNWFRGGAAVAAALVVALMAAELHAGALRQAGAGTSLRFYGNGVAAPGLDRVRIPIDGPERPADIGATDFTIEFWLRAAPGANGSPACQPGNDTWVNGNIIVDRDIFNAGDYGDYGISLYGGQIAFGVNNGSSGSTLCGATNVANNQWRHIAVVRVRDTGLMQIYVDGALDGSVTGPTGDVSYRNGRPTNRPNDPYIVIGAEKHDYGAAYPSFRGWVDELRLSTVRRYNGSFTRPTGPFTPDANTAALYHFDEGSGDVVGDSSGGGSHGTRYFGGSPAGPVWSAETPFTGPPLTPTATPVFGAPTLLAPADAASTQDARPTFSWSSVWTATGYQIEITGSLPPFSAQFDTTAASFRPNSPLLPGAYSWRVRAISAAGPSAWSSPARSLSIASPAGAAPQRNLFVTDTPRLTWGRVSGATGYQLQVASNAAFTSIVHDETVGAGTLEVTLPDRANGLYYWRVRAQRPGGFGAWSPAEFFMVQASS